jgi:hypothetical protein
MARMSHVCVPTITIFSAAALVAFACQRAPEPDSRPSPARSQAPAVPVPSAALEAVAASPHGVMPASAAPHDEGRLEWSDPSGWVRLPQTSPMRVATYRVPHAPADKEDAELAIFHFGGGQGGAVEANLERWEKQFSDTKPGDAKRSERKVNGLNAHLLEIASGTYAAMMPGQASGPKAGFGMIAAVVETPLGSYFVKLTGPSKTVKANHDAYFRLLETLHVAK